MPHLGHFFKQGPRPQHHPSLPGLARQHFYISERLLYRDISKLNWPRQPWATVAMLSRPGRLWTFHSFIFSRMPAGFCEVSSGVLAVWHTDMVAVSITNIFAVSLKQFENRLVCQNKGYSCEFNEIRSWFQMDVYYSYSYIYIIVMYYSSACPWTPPESLFLGILINIALFILQWRKSQSLSSILGIIVWQWWDIFTHF